MRYLIVLLAACTGTVTETDPPDTNVDDTDVDTEVDTDTGPQCADYEPWFDLVVDCGGTWTQVWQMVSLSHPYDGVCPPFYSDLAGGQWGTAAEAYAELECDASCVYRPATAVMLVYCDYRGEYIDYNTGGEGQVGDGSTCGPLIYGVTCAGSAYAADWYAYQAAFVCEDHLDTCPPREE